MHKHCTAVLQNRYSARCRAAATLAGFFAAVVLLASCVAAPEKLLAERPTSYPMGDRAWSMAAPISSLGGVAGSASFARYEGMPSGTMTLNEGVASSAVAQFSDGTIDFDMKPIGYDDAGIIFRWNGKTEGEFVYLRANPDCPAADDCIQYAPVTHGLMQWDIYANYQGPAPIAPTGWNHIRVQVAGEKMLVYVNHASEPSLIVPKLQGLTRDGGIAFKGPAVYANLVVRPGDKLDQRSFEAQSDTPNAITAWLAAPPTAHDASHQVSIEDAPLASAWSPIEVEPTGLVNLSRAFGAARSPSLSIGWLKTRVTASRAMRRNVQIGFARQAWVFLNGHLVFTGDNPYSPTEFRLSPDGRMEADNASVPLDLREGDNEIVLAIGNDWRSRGKVPKPSPYGWGAEVHFDHAEGLKLR